MLSYLVENYNFVGLCSKRKFHKSVNKLLRLTTVTISFSAVTIGLDAECVTSVKLAELAQSTRFAARRELVTDSEIPYTIYCNWTRHSRA